MPAQVPDSFVPSTTQQPAPDATLAASRVDPMVNSAPQQQQQMGEAVMRAGETADSIGERIQYQIDDAKTKQAEAQFLQSAQTILRGDGTQQNPGFLNLRGENAVNGYDDAASALAKAKAQALGGLSNKFQQYMFNRVAQAHLTSFGALMSDHKFQQGTAYAIQSADQRQQTYNAMAANGVKDWNLTDADGNVSGDWNLKGQVADQAVMEAQQQKGYGTDPNSAINAGVLMTARTARVKAGLANMATANASPADVQNFYDAMKAKNWVDPKEISDLDARVKAYVQPQLQKGKQNDAFAQADREINPSQVPAPFNGDYHPVIQGAGFMTSPYDTDAHGVHISAVQNTPVTAPAQATVASVGKNADGVGYVQLTQADGSTTTVTGLNGYNVKVGDQVAMGQQLGLSGDEGSQKGGPSVLWQFKGKDGGYFDPTTAGLPKVDPETITSEPVLQRALNIFADGETNENLKDEGLNQMMGIVRKNQGQVIQGQEQNEAAAASQFFSSAMQNGGRLNVKAIDPQTWNNLTPEQQYKFTKLVTENNKQSLLEATQLRAAQGEVLAQTVGVQNRFWLATHKDATLNDLLAHSQGLTGNEMVDFAGKISGQDSKDAPMNTDRINQSLTDAGLGFLHSTEGQKAPVKIANQQRYLQIHNDLQSLYNDAVAAKKGPLTPKEEQDINYNYLVHNQVHVKGSDKLVEFSTLDSSARNNAYVSVGNSTVPISGISEEQASVIRQHLLAHGINPTEQQISWWWRQNENQRQFRKGMKLPDYDSEMTQTENALNPKSK